MLLPQQNARYPVWRSQTEHLISDAGQAIKQARREAGLASHGSSLEAEPAAVLALVGASDRRCDSLPRFRHPIGTVEAPAGGQKQLRIAEFSAAEMVGAMRWIGLDPVDCNFEIAQCLFAALMRKAAEASQS